MQSSKPFFHTTPAREDVVCTISIATFARNRYNLPTDPSDVEDIIAEEVRLVEESVISSGDSETNTNNDEGENQITEREKEQQLAKQKPKKSREGRKRWQNSAY